MKEKLKLALSQRRKKYNTESHLVPSAVLVPLFLKEGEYHILFTQRTEKVKEHKGQISFPGGAYEEGDGTLLSTALRESAEEIGLAPEAVEVLGELDDMPTIGSDFVISPFVGVIPWPYPFKIDTWEVDGLIEVPLAWLRDKGNIRQVDETSPGEPITTYFYHYRSDVIWGASARILHQFLEIYARVADGEG